MTLSTGSDSSRLWKLDQARIDPPEPVEEPACDCDAHEFCGACGTAEDFKLWEHERG